MADIVSDILERLDYTLLWSVETGSGMWGTKRNDIDISSVYCVDTNKILRGERISQTFPQRKYRNEKLYGDIDIEEQSQEIGHLVNKLIDGNINAIWVVCSPNIINKSHHQILRDLRYITMKNLSKLTYHSVKGMVMNQYKDHVKRASVMPPGKAHRNAIRTANFGSTLLSENKIIFKGIDRDYIPEESEVIEAIARLDIAYETSKLPEKSNEIAFRDFLYHVRLSFVGDTK
jgi:hypothetical protein